MTSICSILQRRKPRLGEEVAFPRSDVSNWLSRDVCLILSPISHCPPTCPLIFNIVYDSTNNSSPPTQEPNPVTAFAFTSHISFPQHTGEVGLHCSFCRRTKAPSTFKWFFVRRAGVPCSSLPGGPVLSSFPNILQLCLKRKKQGSGCGHAHTLVRGM